MFRSLVDIGMYQSFREIELPGDSAFGVVKSGSQIETCRPRFRLDMLCCGCVRQVLGRAYWESIAIS